MKENDALTVRELIEKLQAMDPDAEVWCCPRRSDLRTVVDIGLEDDEGEADGSVYLELGC
jgi:hypothetical protein